MRETNFNRCTPHLPVKNLQQTLDYYRDILGFTEEWIFGEKDGGIRRDDMRLLFTEDADFTDEINTENHRLSLMWFVENIDGVYAEFKKRNVKLADKLRTHSNGLREFAFIDINGYYIRIAEGMEG